MSFLQFPLPWRRAIEIVSIIIIFLIFNVMVHLICLQKWNFWFRLHVSTEFRPHLLSILPYFAMFCCMNLFNFHSLCVCVCAYLSCSSLGYSCRFSWINYDAMPKNMLTILNMPRWQSNGAVAWRPSLNRFWNQWAKVNCDVFVRNCVFLIANAQTNFKAILLIILQGEKTR